MKDNSLVFDRLYSEYDLWYEKNRYAYLSEVEAFKKLLPSNGKGLEIGVGTGRFAVALGISYGIDPSKNMLEIAKKRGIKTFAGRGENLPFNDGEFDFILIAITICFVENPEKVIIESKRVLKNGGRIIIGIIDRESFLGRIYQEKKKTSEFYKNAVFYTPDEIIELLKKNGFTKLSIFQTLFKLPDELDKIDDVKEGYGSGGFVAISGDK